MTDIAPHITCEHLLIAAAILAPALVWWWSARNLPDEDEHDHEGTDQW